MNKEQFSSKCKSIHYLFI